MVFHGSGPEKNSEMKPLRQGLCASAVALLVTSVLLFLPVPASARSTPAVSAHNPPGCTSSHVLLLGSYPSEVSANLDREALDPGQPTVLNGVDFYAGTLNGSSVVIAIAGPAPAATYATTALALKHFGCTSAVVFSGTAGGGGASQLGDVTAASSWTDDNGATSTPVSAAALAVAQSIQESATSQLSTSAPVNDGPCECQGQAEALDVVPILRTPRLIVGGEGTTYGGGGLTCSAEGGMLEGCNPCPPSSGASAVDVNIPVSLGMSSTDFLRQVSLQASRGMIAGARSAPSTHAPAPVGLVVPSTGTTTSGTDFIADDEQTTGAQRAADAYKVPFIAFRGISDTNAVGTLWPSEWLVYQQLAADNSSLAARLWIEQWNRR
jgi:nucleoside phosphorylase